MPLTLLQARGLLCKVTSDGLAFTREECQALVGPVWGMPLSQELVCLLWEKTGGWAAVLMLVLQSLQRRPEQTWGDYLQNLNGGQGMLFDFLASEVMESLPGQVREFVQATSGFEGCRDCPGHLLIPPDVAACCELLRERQLVSYDPKAGIYAYHRLLREFFWQSMGPSQRRAADQSSARLWLSQGRPELAAVPLGQLDWLLERHGPTLLLRGHLFQVKSWLAGFTLANKQSNARLSLLLGMVCELQGLWKAARSHFLRALKLGEEPSVWK